MYRKKKCSHYWEKRSQRATILSNQDLWIAVEQKPQESPCMTWPHLAVYAIIAPFFLFLNKFYLVVGNYMFNWNKI